MHVLGIETSCDETAVSILKDGKEILSNEIFSQIDLHRDFGGVVPELACRKHIEILPILVKNALEKAKLKAKDLGLIAVTSGPGLVGALLTGLTYAKGLSYALKIPFVAVNHIEAHLYVNFIEHKDLQPPCIGLVVSGGHTTLIDIKKIGSYKILGQTLDDAAGEAFDKIAKLLGLGYPGGPIIDKMSKKGNPKAIPFPRAMIKHDNYDFSFSGLKTAVVYYVKGFSQYKKKNKEEKVSTEDIVASFQEAVVDQLIKKTIKAVKKTGYTNLILGGGVSRNSRLRQKLQEETDKHSLKLYLPSPVMCTDNAAMIAALGYIKYQEKGPSSYCIDAKAQMGLGE